MRPGWSLAEPYSTLQPSNDTLSVPLAYALRRTSSSEAVYLIRRPLQSDLYHGLRHSTRDQDEPHEDSVVPDVY